MSSDNGSLNEEEAFDEWYKSQCNDTDIAKTAHDLAKQKWTDRIVTFVEERSGIKLSSTSRDGYDIEVLQPHIDQFVMNFIQERGSHFSIRQQVVNLKSVLRKLGVFISPYLERKIERLNREVWGPNARKKHEEFTKQKIAQQDNLKENWDALVKYLTTKTETNIYNDLKSFLNNQTEGLTKTSAQILSRLATLYNVDRKMFVAQIMKARVIFLMLYYTGMRGKSLFDTTLEDLHFDVNKSKLGINILDRKTKSTKGARNLYTCVVNASDVHLCAITWLSMYLVYIRENLDYDPETPPMLFPYTNVTSARANVAAIFDFLGSVMGFDNGFGAKKVHALRFRLNIVLTELGFGQLERETWIGWCTGTGRVSNVYYNNRKTVVDSSDIPNKLARPYGKGDLSFMLVEHVDENLLGEFNKKQDVHMDIYKKIAISVATRYPFFLTYIPRKVTISIWFRSFGLRALELIEKTSRKRKRQDQTIMELKQGLLEAEENNKKLKAQLMLSQSTSQSSSSSKQTNVKEHADNIDTKKELIEEVNKVFDVRKQDESFIDIVYKKAPDIIGMIDKIGDNYGIALSKTSGKRLIQILRMYGLLRVNGTKNTVDAYVEAKKINKKTTWLSFAEKHATKIDMSSFANYKKFIDFK